MHTHLRAADSGVSNFIWFYLLKQFPVKNSSNRIVPDVPQNMQISFGYSDVNVPFSNHQ